MFNIQIVVFIDIVDTIYGIFFTRIFKKISKIFFKIRELYKLDNIFLECYHISNK